MYEEYIKQYKKYLETNGKLDNEFSLTSRLYSMTTENIYGFLKNYDLRNKKILTVAGSGDQRLNAYLMGASDITCFDINPLTLLQLRLKDSAIKNINYEKFIKFFGIYSRKYGNYYHILDNRIFTEFKDTLDKDTYEFFNYIINESNKDKKSFYFDFDNELCLLKEMNAYLDEDKYYELRKIINDKDVNFIESDLLSLPDKLNDEKFDMILLSNISDYTHQIYDNNDLKEYRLLIDRLMNNLNSYGVLQVGYIYSIYSLFDNVSDFHKKRKREQYFTKDIFNSISVPSYKSYDTNDKVIVYQKTK